MTALSIIQNAARRLVISVPSAVFSSVDDEVIQMRELMNQEGKELARKPWTDLLREQTFTTVAQAVQTSAVPSDFGFYVNDTMFDRTENRKLVGPLNSFEWQREKAGPVFTSVYHAFRFRGGDLLVTPDPTAGNTVAYEYVTSQWAETSGGSGLSSMTADTDVARINEELITLGVMWRFKQAKGLDYAEEFRTYQMELDKYFGQDGGSPVLTMGSNLLQKRFYPANIKEGSWP